MIASGQQKQKFITTKIGNISVYLNDFQSTEIPIIFLHGVYFDHHLWDEVIDSIHDRTMITIDMPLHGLSKEITKADWTLTDCGDMLIEILDSLQIKKAIAVGHSWGSMSILRAASKQPDRFESVLLCNMPFQAVSKKQKNLFRLQHSMLVFRNFYMKQAAKALFGDSTLKENPILADKLMMTMSILSNKEIREIDRKVIIDADDASDMIKKLKVKAIALKGEEDYVPAPPGVETKIIKGGHISPLEQPGEVLNLVYKLF